MHDARLQRALSTADHCTSQGETTASAEDRRPPTVAAAVGAKKSIQKNITITKEIPL